MQGKHPKKRASKLKHTTNQNIGWYVSYRDPNTGMPRRHRLGMASREQVERAYHECVAFHLRGETPGVKPSRRTSDLKLPHPGKGIDGAAVDIVPGSLLDIPHGILRFEVSRVRKELRPIS